MTEYYQDAVLLAYAEKEQNGELPKILTKPTTTRLRKACLEIYKERYNDLKCSDKDADIFSSFFDRDKLGTDFYQVLDKSDPDDFKALSNHLNEKTESTDEKNTELLAWLIDFKHRPSKVFYEELKKKKNESKWRFEWEIFFPKFPIPINKIFIASIAVLLAGLIISPFWERRAESIGNKLLPTGKCMYWKEDHYEPIDCQKRSDIPVISLNMQVLNRLKKITTPDTLTKADLGKVWYSNIKGNREFFTDSGMHPVDTAKRLRPVTPYILMKYTSNYRYLLIRLVWGIGIVSVIIFLVVLIKKELRRNKRLDKVRSAVS